MQTLDHADRIIQFWLGHVETTGLPSAHRTRVWFGDCPSIDQQLRETCSPYLQLADAGQLTHWQDHPRGQLALIILYDQIPRHIERDNKKAYAYDGRALNICLDGLSAQNDHQLSLIERVFFYFPLTHSELLSHQQQALALYKMLYDLSLDDVKTIYQGFLEFAHQNYSVIKQFGRFPTRNSVLNRASTATENLYLSRLQGPHDD